MSKSTPELCATAVSKDTGIEKGPRNVKTANAVTSFASFIRLFSCALSRHRRVPYRSGALVTIDPLVCPDSKIAMPRGSSQARISKMQCHGNSTNTLTYRGGRRSGFVLQVEAVRSAALRPCDGDFGVWCVVGDGD